MNWAIVLLRLVHVVLGVLWVGMMAFTAVFLTPAIRDAGPDGGKVMMALQRRGVMLVVPLIALGTLVSGMWLYQRFYGGFAGLMASRVGFAFGIGGAAAVIAFLLGITVMRSATARANALTAALDTAKTDQERDVRTAEVRRLRARGAAVGRLVTSLLIFAAAAMAVARYL
jgi:uncharacterized membrane protein